MEFALCLGYGTPPTTPLFIHSTMNATKTTKLCFSSSHSSLLLSSFSKCRRLGHVFSPVVCAVDGSSLPSTNGKDYTNKLGRGRVGASLILACALGIIGCSSRMNLKAIAMAHMPLPVLGPMVSMETHALKSYLDVIECLASSEAEPSKVITTSKLPKKPSREQVDKFKIEMLRSGKPNEAIIQLQKEYEICNYKKDYEPAFNLEMALVEIYMFQGKYKEALERNCLKDDSFLFDKRVTLYKAIAHTILAKRHWEEFTEIFGGSPINKSSPKKNL